MKIKSYIICLFFGLVVSFPICAQVINAGVGGNSTVDLLGRLDADVLQQNPDLVILMVGTNDMLNSRKMLSYTSYEINLRRLIVEIQEVGSKVLLVSPPTVDSVYLFDRHKKELFKEAPNVKLDSVRNIMLEVTADYGLHFIDVHQTFKKRNLPEHNKDFFIQNESNSGRRDGVHPTALGYRYIAELVYTFSNREYESFENMKIVCFGDSITYGSGVKNGGTVRGESYPAVLAGLIKKNSIKG